MFNNLPEDLQNKIYKIYFIENVIPEIEWMFCINSTSNKYIYI